MFLETRIEIHRDGRIWEEAILQGISTRKMRRFAASIYDPQQWYESSPMARPMSDQNAPSSHPTDGAKWLLSCYNFTRGKVKSVLI